MEDIEARKAKRRQGERTDLHPTSSSNELKVGRGQARDKIARQVGLSPTTYQRAKKVIEERPDDIKQSLQIVEEMEVKSARFWLARCQPIW